MKKILSLLLSIMLIMIMVPLTSFAEEQVAMETGTLTYEIVIDPEIATGDVTIHEVVGNDYNVLVDGERTISTVNERSIQVNSTTSSIIKITVDLDQNGIDEGDVWELYEVPIFHDLADEIKVIARLDSNGIAFKHHFINEPVITESYYQANFEFHNQSSYAEDTMIWFRDVNSTTFYSSSFVNSIDWLILTARVDQSIGLDLELIVDQDGNHAMTEADLTYTFEGYANLEKDFNVFDVVLTDQGIQVNHREVLETLVKLDAPEKHEVMYFDKYNRNKWYRSEVIYNPGVYNVYLTDKSNENELSLYEIKSFEVLTGDSKIVPIEPDYTRTIQVTGDFQWAAFQFNRLNLSIDGVRIESLSDISQAQTIRTNNHDLETSVLLTADTGSVEVELMDQTFDFSSTEVLVGDKTYTDLVSVYDAILLKDSQGNTARIKRASTENSFMEVAFDGGSSSNRSVGSFDMYEWPAGAYDLLIQIPELGIDYLETIHIGDIPVEAYDSYTIEMTDLDGTPIIDGYAYYSELENRFRVYLPENSETLVKAYGLNGNERTLLDISFAGDKESSVAYDSDLGIMSVGPVLGGYSDTNNGTVDGSINMDVYTYSGNLGRVDITTPDGTPYSGRVMMTTMYKFTNSESSGSLHDAYVHDGELLFPIQTDFIGIDYAYIVVSPTNTETTKYANTPFVDMTEAMSILQEGIYSLGQTRFQEAVFIGSIFDKNQEPVDGTMSMATGFYTGDAYGFNSVEFNGSNGAGDNANEIYFAPLGEGFEETMHLKIHKPHSDFQLIETSIDLSEGSKEFHEVPSQIQIEILNAEGELLVEGSGYDRTVYASVENDPNRFHMQLTTDNQSTSTVGGFIEGDEVTMWLHLDIGDFDHLKLLSGNKVTFTYTSIPGNYKAVDEAGKIIPYIVDSDGLMHLKLQAQKAQLFGRVMLGDRYVDTHLQVSILDPVTGAQIAASSVRNSGGYNNQEVMYGVISIGYREMLVGDYIVKVEDPKNTIEYTGTEILMTFPLEEDVLIDLPKSRAFGKVQLTGEDEALFANRFIRVFVNIFDENGTYVKNALVRNDGYFSAGKLPNGRYFAKVFVSPFSPLVQKYASSKMHTFELSNTVEVVDFRVPLVQTMGSGTIETPDASPATQVWVNIMNAQGTVVESVKTDDQGKFSIPVLENGKYSIKALGNGRYFDSISYDLVVENKGLKSVPEIKLTNLQVYGTIADAQGTPLVSDILVYDLSKNLITSTQTDQNGNYGIGGLSNGNYTIQAIPLNKDFDTTELEGFSFEGNVLKMDLDVAEAKFTGRVFKSEGNPAQNGWVHFYHNLQYVKSIKINSDGTYAVGGIDTSGTYTALAEVNNQMSEMLTIKDKKIEDIVIASELPLQGVLSIDGQALSRIKFVVYDAGQNPILQSRTNVFGEFSIKGLDEGSYTFAVFMGDVYYVGEIASDGNGGNAGTVTLIRGE